MRGVHPRSIWFRTSRSVTTAKLVARREVVPFVSRELGLGADRASYRLRGAPDVFLIRHATQDLGTLREVFLWRGYEPPAEVEERLAAILGAPRIVDLGGNIGLFCLFAAKRFGTAPVVTFEPDPDSARLLRGLLSANGFDTEVVEACAGVREGFAFFAAGQSSLSHVVENPEASAIRVRTVDALPYLCDCDMAKIDIEGGEWALFSDPRFALDGPEVVVCEAHRHLCPTASPRVAADSLLRDAGYEIVSMGDDGPQGEFLLWALKEPPL